MFAIFPLFILGPLKTKHVFELINIRPKYDFPVKLPSGNVIKFKTSLLFAGNATQHINLDAKYLTFSPAEKGKRVYDYALPQLNLFRIYLQSYVDKMDVTQTFRYRNTTNNPYFFNKMRIQI